MAARLKERYLNEIRPNLMKELGIGNVMRAPRPLKVVVNMGVTGARDDRKILESAATELSRIAGQKPAITRAKKSVANFKIRKGMAIGCRVTLRGERMYEFLDRLISTALPRIRDFRGLPPDGFDGRGNYSLGVTEQTIFPEIHYDEIEATRGMDITIVTSAHTDAEARALLLAMGMPLKRN
jgi:large subunit ribosomal protein L5